MCRFNFFHIVFVLYFASLPMCTFAWFKYPESNYTIVIDVQVESTEVFVYEFNTRLFGKLRVYNQYSNITRFGLRTFIHDFGKGLDEVRNLLMAAKGSIRKKYLGSTYVMLKISGNENFAAQEVTKFMTLLRLYVYTTELLVDHDSVSFTGDMRGPFSWVTVNLLLGRLKVKLFPPVGVLDLGGYYSHEGLVPWKISELKPWQLEHVTQLKAFKNTFKVFGHSIPGYGLFEARLDILTMDRDPETDIYRSVCIHPDSTGTWAYHGVVHTYEGVRFNSTFKSVDYKACTNKVKAFIVKFNKTLPMLWGDIYAISNFFEVAMQAGLVGYNETKTVTIDQVKAQAKRECKLEKPNHPFTCMDMIYVNVLLRKVYKLNKTTKITLTDKLKEQKLSWTMGAAFEKYTELKGY